jgi:hypothetical protein
MFVFILVLSDYLVQSVKVLPFYKYIFFMQNVCKIKIVNSLIRDVISFRVIESNVYEIPLIFLDGRNEEFSWYSVILISYPVRLKSIYLNIYAKRPSLRDDLFL